MAAAITSPWPPMPETSQSCPFNPPRFGRLYRLPLRRYHTAARMSGLTVRRLAPPAKMLHAGLSGTQRQGKFVKISTMIRFSAGAGSHDRLVARTVDYARRIEAAGFPGIWVGDSMGRGRPTLDPLVELAVLSAVTERVELGIGVLQLSLRHPVELAHRVQSVQALSGGRLRLGVGSGSTKDDFDLLGYDYDKRFGMLRSHLRSMQATWRGESALSTWPGCAGGPPILIGAWR